MPPNLGKMGMIFSDGNLLSTTVYDAACNLISTTQATDFPQETTSTVYDAMGRVVKTVNADGTYTTDQYDPDGNLIYSTDAMGRVTQYIYNSRDEQIATINPDGSVVTTQYDGGGRVVATTDGNGNTTQFAYDKLGRKVEEIQPSPDAYSAASATADAGYDPMGDLGYVPSPSPVAVGDANFGATTPTATGTMRASQCVSIGSSWTFTRTLPLARCRSGIVANNSEFNNLNAPDGGTQAALLKVHGSISQSIAFPRQASTPSVSRPLFVPIMAPSSGVPILLEVEIDGEMVGTFTPASSSTWTSYLATFTIAASGSHTLSFVGLDNWGRT